jgi:hypothetical protein
MYVRFMKCTASSLSRTLRQNLTAVSNRSANGQLCCGSCIKEGPSASHLTTRTASCRQRLRRRRQQRRRCPQQQRQRRMRHRRNLHEHMSEAVSVTGQEHQLEQHLIIHIGERGQHGALMLC